MRSLSRRPDGPANQRGRLSIKPSTNPTPGVLGPSGACVYPANTRLGKGKQTAT